MRRPAGSGQLDGESCCPHGRPSLLLFCQTLAGCKVAGNALHDRPWWPGGALQSRVSSGQLQTLIKPAPSLFYA